MSNFNEKKKYHFLYKTVNTLNDKFYIGIHSTSNLKDGYLGSGKRIKYAIDKYGKDNFKFEILEFFEDRESLLIKEREIVNSELLKDPNCLNLQRGGTSGFDYIKQLRLNNPEYDKQWKALQGNKLKKAHIDGKIKYDTFIDKKHKEETKRIIGEINSIKQKGEKNSQYGTMWITNGIENKKIKKDDPIYDGWKLGRIFKKVY